MSAPLGESSADRNHEAPRKWGPQLCWGARRLGRSAIKVKRVSFVSLGCAKNLVDTEVMIAKLGAAGLRARSATRRDADTVVINTCAFIDPAKGRIDRSHPRARAAQAARSATCWSPAASRSATANSCNRSSPRSTASSERARMPVSSSCSTT